jgi:L-seryl-tRNA(Ser) seleniumtransferase
MPQDSLKHDVDVVTFSGDKLMGGPQAGIIVGKKEFVDRMKRNPLARALRVDKMVLAAMEETLRNYLDADTVFESIPTLKAISYSLEDLEPRARQVAEIVGKDSDAFVEVGTSESQVGGGSLPTEGLTTSVIRISSSRRSPDEIISRLRQCEPPVIARILEDKVVLDLRTVQPSEDGILAQLLVQALAGGG